MPNVTLRPATTVLVLAAAVLLAACDRAAEVRRGSQKPPVTVSRAAKDLAITADIKTRLAGDSQLGALVIHVQTNEGLARLRGTAPDTDTRRRAAEVAQGVTGVVGVQNDLSVQLLAK